MRKVCVCIVWMCQAGVCTVARFEGNTGERTGDTQNQRHHLLDKESTWPELVVVPGELSPRPLVVSSGKE